jgi:hypothetical protein
MSVSAPLRVLLSYAHESTEHRARVKALAQRLESEGLEITLDAESAEPAEGWWVWLEREVTAADLVLVVISAAYQTAFGTPQLRWPGPVLSPALYAAEVAHRPFLPVVFSEADAAYPPEPMVQQTCYRADTEQDVSLLLRTLRGFASAAESEPQTRSAMTRGASPLPPLDQYLTGLQARLTFHRRAWRYFRSKLEGLGITLEEQPMDENGVQKLTGPGIAIALTQHSEHAEARLDILPGTAPVYAAQLGLVAVARQPLECTFLVFTLKPEWNVCTPYEALAERLAGTDIKLHREQGLLLHGWRFIIPALTVPEALGAPLKIVPRPAYPWPLNPLRLLLYLMNKSGGLYR